MENLQLILVTVLITLLSVAVVGSIVYLVAVVRKLRRVVKDNVVDITNLQNTLNAEVQNVRGKINNVQSELDNLIRGKINNVQSELDNLIHELDRKIDSRCDKLYDGYNKEVELVYQELQKRDKEVELVYQELQKRDSIKK